MKGRTSGRRTGVERETLLMVVVMMLFFIALNTNLDHLLEHGGVLPADRGETRSRVQDGDGLDGLQSDANAGDVAGGRHVDLDETSHDLVIGHGRSLVSIWQRAVGRVQEDGILKEV